MAIIANFSGSILRGESPLTVHFVDLSSGSPDRWLWDFGDGGHSDEQNPTHVFTGTTGTNFNVKLTVWVFDSNVEQGVGTVNRQTKLKSNVATNATCFADFVATSYGSNSQEASVYLNKNLGTGDPRNFTYLGARFLMPNTILPSLTGTDVAYVIEAKRQSSSDIGTPTWDIQSPAGEIKLQVDGGQVATISSGGYDSDFKPIHDISYKGGTGSFNWDHQPSETILPDGGDGVISGMHVIVRLLRYVATTEEDMDTEEKESYIGIGILSENVFIDFVGTPLTGTSPLPVQFTDLSNVEHALSVWEFGDGNSVTFAGETHPLNTYTTDSCSLALL